jgi:hypothetical protein
MERLTNAVEVKSSQETIKKQIELCGEAHPKLLRYVKLAAYEETGLESEDVIKLNDFEHSQLAKVLAKLQAYQRLEEQGLLIKLDCTDCKFNKPLNMDEYKPCWKCIRYDCGNDYYEKALSEQNETKWLMDRFTKIN